MCKPEHERAGIQTAQNRQPSGQHLERDVLPRAPHFGVVAGDARGDRVRDVLVVGAVTIERELAQESLDALQLGLLLVALV